MKRENYIDWDEYFMSLAIISALRSKDPVTQVGCCIIQPETHKVISLGYNGFPRGCSDDEFPWDKNDTDIFNQKYPYVVHAELNAILNANQNLSGCDLYVTLSPCYECTKAIIQSGIKKIVYLEKYKPESKGYIAMKKMIDVSRIEFVEYKLRDKTITIQL